jgi:hypothetical protein
MIQSSKSILEKLPRTPSDIPGALVSMMKGPDERLFGRSQIAAAHPAASCEVFVKIKFFIL